MQKEVFVIHVIFLFTLMTSPQAKSIKSPEKHKTLNKRFKAMAESHPCDKAPKNTVIHTANGDIMCLRTSEQELEMQLERNGGYNRRYAAPSIAKAKKYFKNMFKYYGRDYENTTEWQKWRSSSLSDVSLNEYSTTLPALNEVSFLDSKKDKQKKLKSNHKIDPYEVQDDRQRRSVATEDSEITKREEPGMNIQCLPAGRHTEKGIHLCPACQRLTELGAAFFPRYVNEMTCHDSQNASSAQAGCYLTNNFQIGTCQQITMTIDLLMHKNGKFAIVYQNETFAKFKEVYEPYTHEISICCECMVFSSLVGQ